MSILSLRDVGKIYVSESNVTVGIRGVNLDFDKGEFVAVTGKSGSGKSTLLNVISGMDSYEEGELYIEGEPTSHYVESDWEEYREKYISFIFQDYNIIDSFTVLQNVELALMEIEDRAVRRARALELIERVGLTSHLHHKGSKLSGGQKQRTVIARALAKDSPVILADEPTGNLDSKTSEEIISLLREVSRDKLLIVVTHNFDEVEKYATRHVRVFDGVVESDTAITSPTVCAEDENDLAQGAAKTGSLKKSIKNGILLGKTMFFAKPRLSVFLCLLMMIGALGIFLSTSLAQEASAAFEPTYMFTHIDGRVILTTRNGSVLSEDEVKKIKDEYGAVDYLRFDSLLDQSLNNQMYVPMNESDVYYEYISPIYTYRESFGNDIIGRYPEAVNEVFLYLPISYRDIFGKDALVRDQVFVHETAFTVTGVKYYVDNNKTPKCLFTEEGFAVATAIHYMIGSATTNVSLSVSSAKDNLSADIVLYTVIPSFEVEDGKLYVSSEKYEQLAKEAEASGLPLDKSVSFSAMYYNYNLYYYGGGSTNKTFDKNFGNESFTDEKPEVNLLRWYDTNREMLIISDELLLSTVNEVLDKSYKQVSLFFEDDEAAYEAAERLNAAGYVAVTSDTTYEAGAETVIFNLLQGFVLICFWFLSVSFLAFFLNLCSSRSLESQKEEVAIMRSMGIKADVIKIGAYFRMLLALVPGALSVLIVATLIFTSPAFNGFLNYLYAWQYALIFLGMLLLTIFTTRKQILHLFGQSVKKTLKGGTN